MSNGNGYMLADTATPDGYTVHANGAWTVNGVVQMQTTVTEAAAAANERQTQTAVQTNGAIPNVEKPSPSRNNIHSITKRRGLYRPRGV